MTLVEFLFLSIALWFGLSCLAAAVWALIASHRRPSPPPPEPEIVNWISVLPPVPASNTLNSWTEYDDVALAWFAEGAR